MRQVAKDTGVKRWLVSPISQHECILESVAPGIPLNELIEEMQGRIRIMQEVDAELGADNRLIDRVYYMEF